MKLRSINLSKGRARRSAVALAKETEGESVDPGGLKWVSPGAFGPPVDTNRNQYVDDECTGEEGSGCRGRTRFRPTA